MPWTLKFWKSVPPPDTSVTWNYGTNPAPSNVSTSHASRITDYLNDIASISTLAQTKLSAYGQDIRIGYRAGDTGEAFFGPVDDYFLIDIDAAANIYFFNTLGQLVAADVRLTLMHELAHIYLSVGELQPASEATMNGANFDFRGPVINEQNSIAENAGLVNQIQSSFYAAFDSANPRFGYFTPNISYTSGNPIDTARLGDDAANIIDHSNNTLKLRDLLFGLNGDDTLTGGGGTDFLYGRADNDTINGGDDRDVLHGNEGNDSLDGGKGADLLHGGDHRSYAGGRTSLEDDGVDVVNYSLNQDFAASGVQISIFAGNDTANADQSFAPGTTATDPDDFLTALFVKDLGADGATDTLISIETITATAAADTLAIRTLDATKFAGADSMGGARTIDLAGNPAVTAEGMGDHVDFSGLEEAVTIDLRAETITAGTINLHATSATTRGVIVKGVERVTGGEGHLTVWSSGNGEYRAGEGGATFHLKAGDVAYGYDGVVDKFYFDSLVPEGLTDAEKLQFCQTNRNLLYNVDLEDLVYVDGILCNGNTVGSEALAIVQAESDVDTSAIVLTGNSSYGTVIPAPEYTPYAPYPQWGYYAFDEDAAYRDVIFTQTSATGPALIEFISTTLTSRQPNDLSGGGWENIHLRYTSEFVPEASLTLVINDYSDGDGGMSFSHDALAMRASPYLRTQGFTYSNPESSWLNSDEMYDRFGFSLVSADYEGEVVAIVSDLKHDIFDGVSDRYVYAGGSTVLSSDPRYNFGETLTKSATIDWFTFLREDFSRPATEDFGPGGDATGAAASAKATDYEPTVDILGDVNGDGLADVLVVDPDGPAHLVFGNVAGRLPGDLRTMTASEGVEITRTGLQGNYARAFTGAGDVDGDGSGDFLISADVEPWPSGGDYPESEVFLVYGKPSGWADIDLDLLASSERTLLSGFTGPLSLEGIGDFNGDGQDDYVVDVLAHDGSPMSTAGGLYVLFGSASRPAQLDLSTLTAGQGFFLGSGFNSENLDARVSAAGDVNGDGYADILIGAPGADDGVGKAILLYGRASGFSEIDLDNLAVGDGFVISGGSSVGVGRSVAGLGDFNGDGRADIAIGSAARSYVIFGDAAGATINLGALGAAGMEAGAIGFAPDSVTAAGDINGDGLRDLMIRAQSGLTRIVFGRDDGLRYFDFNFSGADESAAYWLDWAAKGGGDFNGDGSDDLLTHFYDGIAWKVQLVLPASQIGSPDSDSLVGTASADIIAGAGGGDTLKGVDGDDRLNGNTGDDSLVGNAGNDTLRGGADRDTLKGGGGDDWLIGGSGADALHGGNGFDYVDYSSSAQMVVADLKQAANNQGDALGDSYSGIENLGGGLFSDVLRGDDLANWIEGFDGADQLVGRAGDDTLAGGAGQDSLTGGTGADSFELWGRNSGDFDRIVDFESGVDTITLIGFDIAPGALAAGSFAVGNAAADADDRLIYNASAGKLFFDPDGDGAEAQVHIATLSGLPTLSAADFVVI